MRGRGFEPHTERMLNAGNGLQLLNMERQEPIFLLQTDEHSLISQAESEWIFYVPQHTCAGHDSGGLLLSHISHAPFATRWYGTNHLYIKVWYSRIRTTHTSTHSGSPSHPMLQSLDVRCRGSNPGSLSLRAKTLKRCITTETAVGIEPTTHLFIKMR